MQFRGAALALVAALASIAHAADGASPWPAALVNSLGMRFVLVPAGTFLMGSDESPQALAAAFPDLERRRFDELADEAPVHRVRITRAFYLGQHEVTVGQFRRFVERSGYVPESIADGTGGYGYDPAYEPSKSARGDAFDGPAPKYSWRNPGLSQGDEHPVVHVTWHGAVAMARMFCQNNADLAPLKELIDSQTLTAREDSIVAGVRYPSARLLDVIKAAREAENDEAAPDSRKAKQKEPL